MLSSEAEEEEEEEEERGTVRWWWSGEDGGVGSAAVAAADCPMGGAGAKRATAGAAVSAAMVTAGLGVMPEDAGDGDGGEAAFEKGTRVAAVAASGEAKERAAAAAISGR